MTQNFNDRSYYEILEVPLTASYQDVEEAYQLAKKSFHPQSSALYGILAQDEAQGFYKEVEEAYQTLIEPRRRQEYDQFLNRTDPNEARLLSLQKNQAPILKVVSKHDVKLPEWAQNETEYSGAFFQKLRHHYGFMLEDISHKLKIKKSYVLAIESEDFESLPSQVYVKGYIKSICKILDLDPEAASKKYMARFQEES